jgi:hypothetical protein
MMSGAPPYERQMGVAPRGREMSAETPGLGIPRVFGRHSVFSRSSTRGGPRADLDHESPRRDEQLPAILNRS